VRAIPSKAIWAYLLLGCAASIAAMFVGDAMAVGVYAVAAVQMPLVMWISYRVYDVPKSMVVVLTGVGLCFAAGAAIEAGVGDTGAPRFLSNVFALAGAIVIVVGLSTLVRRRRGMNAAGVLGDALIVGLGSWLISWVAFLEPTLRLSDEPLVSSLIAGFYQPIGSVILFLMAVYLFTESTSNVSSWLIGGAVLVMLVGDLLVALAGAGHVGDGVLVVSTALHTMAYFTVAAAFMHRSITAIEHSQGNGSSQRLLGRLIITTSSLVFPVIVLAASGPQDTADQIVRSVSALVLAGAVTLRVVFSVRANSDAQAELLRAAQTDPLTGLPNRILLLEQISSYVHEAWRADREPTLYFVDLDRFKNINDSLGHSAGDEVLRIVAERLVNAAPHEAMVARLSGDEYVVLDPTTKTLSSASVLAERLLAVFREPVALAQGDVFVTASIGVSSIDSMAAKPEDVLRHADTAMYRAKDSGRNCMAFYDESMHERIAHRLAVETALYRALDRHELRMFHQPILDLDTGEVVGFEALMRWQQGDGTIVSPAEFIPIAEETGTIVPIGAWALLEALTQLRRWIDDSVCSPQATMSVNVSPRQLADPSLPSIVSEALARSGVDASHLWIEITESVMITEPELALATLQKMKALGVRVALDDFGTGYSSLSLLQRFPLQRIKIDRAFVQGVADNPSDRALVRTIIAMGTSLGLDMVAEGVESLHQIQVLHELGCRKAQGYLISHPVPADAMRSTVSALERVGRFPLLRGEHRAGQL
jgi:diguanylate cyclase (GGDEF)-like protein